MDNKDSLTNEQLLKKFKSQFELVNYAINYTAHKIRAGRDSSNFSTTNQNIALQSVDEIVNGIDLERPIEKIVEVTETIVVAKSSPKERANEYTSKRTSEKKGLDRNKKVNALKR